MAKPAKCPYCGKEVVLRNSDIIYGKSYGNVWMCSNWPKCDAYVGCHNGTKKPLGRLANKELRYWKKKAHYAFDSIWKSGRMDRSTAYSWLANKLNIPGNKCHIGMFDIDRCKSVCELSKVFEQNEGI
jgi:hypothetical protein